MIARLAFMALLVFLALTTHLRTGRGRGSHPERRHGNRYRTEGGKRIISRAGGSSGKKSSSSDKGRKQFVASKNNDSRNPMADSFIKGAIKNWDKPQFQDEVKDIKKNDPELYKAMQDAVDKFNKTGELPDSRISQSIMNRVIAKRVGANAKKRRKGR